MITFWPHASNVLHLSQKHSYSSVFSPNINVWFTKCATDHRLMPPNSVMLNHSPFSPRDVTTSAVARLLKPAAGERSQSVQGFPLQSCTLIHLFQTSRREEAAEGQTSIITEEKTSPEWHRGPAAETWSGQTVTWKESLRGRGGGGAKAKVSRAAVIVEL